MSEGNTEFSAGGARTDSSVISLGGGEGRALMLRKVKFEVN